MVVKRDEFGQLAEPWTTRDFYRLEILEEIASPHEHEEKSLAAYMADIYEVLSYE